MVDLNRVIVVAMKSRKIFFGSKQTIAAAKSGKAAALILASNCPPTVTNDIKHYSELSKVPLYIYPASSVELGIVCGKPFAVSALFIRETNNPEIITMKQKLNMESKG